MTLSIKEAIQRALLGATRLDKEPSVNPDWRLGINLTTLNIANGDNCVLGQCFDGGYEHGIGVLFGFWGDKPLTNVECAMIDRHGFAALSAAECETQRLAWVAILSEQQSLALIIQNMNGWSEREA